MADTPIELTSAQLNKINPMTETAYYMGGIWGDVRAGQTWLAHDGKRFIVSASNGVGIFFILAQATDPTKTGKIFYQSCAGFKGDVTTYPLSEGARRAEHWVRIGEIEMNVLMGIAAACSGIGFIALLGTDLLSFITKNKDNFGKWAAAVGVALAVRDVLKKHAPTLYDKLIDAALLSAATAVGGSITSIPSAIANDPKVIGRAAGAIVGKLGKKAATARLTALSAIWILLSTFLLKALSAVPGAVAISVEEKTLTANQIIEKLRSSGVTLSLEDARKIVDEVAAHPRELQDSLRKLREAFEGLTVE